MVVFEAMSLGDAVWLTMTTMTTVGYGDLSASTWMGRTVTILLMYVLGIFLLAQIAGEWIDYRLDRKERMRRGHWRWKMKDHIVIINTPEVDSARYLNILVEQIRGTPKLHDLPIQILSAHFEDGLPHEIANMGVVLHHGRPEGQTDLADVDIDKARFIVLLAVDTSAYRSDSLTLDVLDQIKRFDVSGYIVAECVYEENRDRLKRHGASAVIRPVRAYPELMVRALSAPGTETIFEDLFQYAGNHARRYDVILDNKPWGVIASVLLTEGLGTPIGFMDAHKEIIVNPAPSVVATGSAIFVIAHHDSEPDPARVEKCLKACS